MREKRCRDARPRPENQKRFLIRMTDGWPSHLEILLDHCEGYLNAYSPATFEGFPDELIIRLFQEELFNEKGRLALGFKKQIQIKTFIL